MGVARRLLTEFGVFRTGRPAAFPRNGIRPRRVIAIAVPIGLAVGLAASIYGALTAPASLDWRGDLSGLEDGPTRSYTGDRFSVTDSMRWFSTSVWIDHRTEGLALDRTELSCHGGRAHITWHIGNLEPTDGDTGINLGVRLDGEVVGGVLRGSRVDTWGDAPLDIHTMVDCPSGHHVVDLFVRNVDGAWGFPYVVSSGQDPAPEAKIGRGFIIQEAWATESD